MVSDTQVKLAEDRTEWAWHRTVLARERTFAAWMRTGLTAAGAGFVIARVAQAPGDRWIAIAIGVSFILVGVLVQGVAFWEFRKMARAQGGSAIGSFPLSVVTALSLVVLGGSLAVAVLLVVEG